MEQIKTSRLVGLLTIIGLNLLSIGLLIFILFALGRESARVVELTKNNIAAEAKQDNFRLLQRSFEQTAEGRAKMANYFVDGGDSAKLANFIKQLEETSREAGVSYNLSGTQPTTVDGREALGLSLAVDGSFKAIFRFLNLLENLPYRFEFVQASWGLGGGVGAKSSGEPVWHGSFDLILISFKS